jgi:hypothetical protein
MPISNISKNHEKLTDAKLDGLPSLQIMISPFITSQGRKILEQMYYLDDRTTTKEKMTTTMSFYSLNICFELFSKEGVGISPVLSQ